MSEDGCLLFIYGTLLEGQRAHHIMQNARSIGAGSIAGRLVHVDQYPGYLRGGNARVKGALYRVDGQLLQTLDEYEGCFETPPHYNRELVDVVLDEGDQVDSVEASVYVFQRLEPEHERIENGDWVEWFQNKKA